MGALIQGTGRIVTAGAALIKPTKELKYSTNWNSKLFCRFHTSIRRSKGFYKQGDYLKIILNDSYAFKGLIHQETEIFMSQLNEVTARLDTGYSLQETKAILNKMYPGTDWQTQKLSVLLIENIEWNKP